MVNMPSAKNVAEIEITMVLPDTPLQKMITFFRTPVEGDPYNRSKYTRNRDILFGVSEYQLEQRYGKLNHEVVPKITTFDWVDELDDVMVNFFKVK